MIKKIPLFLSEVVTELKKVTWSTRQELVDATIIVVISAAILGLYIAGIDVVLSRLLTVIIQ